MKLPLFKILIFALIAMSLVKNSFAQSTEPKVDTELALPESGEEKGSDNRTESADQKKTSGKKAQTANKTKPPKKVFKPTEEISEDSPVPFPVDI